MTATTALPGEAELGAAVAAAEFAATNGCVVRVLESAGFASQRAVIFLHGRGHAGAMWFPLLPALAARHRVLAPDLPGFGGSTAPADTDPGAGLRGDPERALRFFVDPIEDLLLARAPGGVSLVGHSLGGLVAIELALRGRVRVDRLVLLDAMGLGPRMTVVSRLFFRAGPERLARLLGRRLFERLNPAPATPVGQRAAALEHQLLAVAGGRPRAARAFDQLCPLSGPVFHRQPLLSRLAVPTLIVWGENDRALPIDNAREAAALLPAARLLTLPCGHSPHLEQPDLLLPQLNAFLEL